MNPKIESFLFEENIYVQNVKKNNIENYRKVIEPC